MIAVLREWARTRKLSRVRGKRLAIYTAICSGYDSIKLPNTLDPRLDYILFSDRPAPATGVWQLGPVHLSYEGSAPAVILQTGSLFLLFLGRVLPFDIHSEKQCLQIVPIFCSS
jgi:hypothetical protein